MDIFQKPLSDNLQEVKRMRYSFKSIDEVIWAHRCGVHVRSQPVLEILSVRLQNEHDFVSEDSTKESWEVYGNIYIFDGKNNNMCSIYERTIEPEVIPLVGGALSLTCLDNFVSMDAPIICVDIRDKVTGETVVDGFAPLYNTIDTAKQHHQFEQFQTTTVPGNGCSAVVDYLALTFGVIGFVEVELSHQLVAGIGGDDEEERDVYGIISAEYDLFHFENGVNRITLFEIEENSGDFEMVTVGSPITLSRSVVAVPAYSSLIIQVKLWDRATNMPIVSGSCKFDTNNNLHEPKVISGLCCFSALSATVSIDWKEPFMLNESYAENYRLEKNIAEFLSMPPELLVLDADHVVEVFSIFIGRQEDKQLSLHGVVNFSGAEGLINLFERDQNDPYIMAPGCNLLPLRGPKNALTPGNNFYLSVDLEDIESGVSIKGIAHSTFGIDNRLSHWHDCLLCSVVKGMYEQSFAAVHYTVFSQAIKATLKVRFMFKGEHSADACSKIHGSLVARYAKCGYRTRYEKLYFRSVLFEKPAENPLEKPCKDFDMELSKSVVAVPHGYSSLLLTIDLSCLSSGLIQFIKDTREIQVGTGIGDGVTIEGDGVGINITVEWSQA